MVNRLLAVLMRHGDYRQPPGVPSAHLPHPLTAEGITQARASAEELQHMARQQACQLWSTIHSSRLLRAWQTAQLVAQELGRSGVAREIEQTDQLAERCVGAAANLTIQQIAEVMEADPRYGAPPEQWKSDPDYRLPLPGAESLMEAGGRVAAWIDDRLADVRRRIRTDTCVLFVGHGAAFRHAAVHLGVLQKHEVTGLSMHHCKPVWVEQDPSGGYRHVAGEWKVRTATVASEEGHD